MPPPPAPDSKWVTALSILSRFSGVKDIATVRFSLPAHLLERILFPKASLTTAIPNLEYWGYLDCPDYFAAIPDPPSPFLRMLACVRWSFTKDIKFFGKVCKPYNSVLGEFFRCHWDVPHNSSLPPHHSSSTLASSETTTASESTVTTKSTMPSESGIPPIRISYITEQTCHHPPVSAFVIHCPQKNITACGMDQISARFTGAALKISPGQHNLGIFISCRDNEVYNYTHPTATVSGFLRGAPYITVEGSATISCPATKVKTIISYLEEKWIGKPKFQVQGLVFEYDPSNDDIHKLKNVPADKILAHIHGSWRSKIKYTLTDSTDSHVLIDLTDLTAAPKIIPPLEKQLPHESQRVWQHVTEALQKAQYSHATKMKNLVEEHQRQQATQRKMNNESWVPRYFSLPILDGKPTLSPEVGLSLFEILH
ncbi:Oxysterol-binding protein-like protein 1 [Neolecta irregularis DAH-3]|uniref:Oxysterol-binding protein-like protein 1 n=1 Tax=Neolecta irregularis (strain DAH-3) TaxID=1198029 RepID=A0A1U7LH57_NEOID|nr:Oxysterol-binding protein-like protein 1 [Neolecta irregularis DAH-3]|eukprot:OLL21861.1 Oxysterol-binding protein-like protein 1 [Neolecta irregularis DAH-3]